jgi:1-acyl-sn-glycerol-3-phosphate acyltransferase
MQNIIYKLIRLIAKVYIYTFYNFSRENARTIPNEGAALLTCNHVTFIDWLFIIVHSPRPVYFVMYYRFMQIPILGKLLQSFGIIPICSRKECPILLEEANKQIRSLLLQGNLVCIFPEGMLTRDGQLNEFKAGVERILKYTPVPVVPMTLKGLWGGFWSHSGKGPFKGFLTRFRPKVQIASYSKVQPQKVSRTSLFHFTSLNLK